MYINIWPINSGQSWLFVLLSLLKRSVINGYADLLAWDDHAQELCRCRPTCITPHTVFHLLHFPLLLLLPFPFSHSLFHLSTPFPLSASLSLTTTLISPPSPSLLTERRGGRTRTNGSLPLSSFSLSLSFLFPLRHFLGLEDW